MELRQLKHFLAVLEHGSMSKAAEALGISHQGLSKSLAGLEEAVQVQLLVRGPRGVTPSTYGEVLAEYARFIDCEHENAINAISALRGGGAGRLTIASGISAAAGVLPIAAARLFQRRPATTLTFLTGPYHQFRAAVEDGSVAMFIGTIADGELSATVTAEKLFDDHDYIVARSGHPLVARPRVVVSDLAAFPWVFSVGTLESRRAFIRLFESAGAPAPRSMIESDSIEATKAALMQTDFLALLPRQAIHAEERAGLLGMVPFDSPGWTREVAVVHRRRGARFGLIDAMIEELRRATEEVRSGRSGERG